MNFFASLKALLRPLTSIIASINRRVSSIPTLFSIYCLSNSGIAIVKKVIICSTLSDTISQIICDWGIFHGEVNSPIT